MTDYELREKVTEAYDLLSYMAGLYTHENVIVPERVKRRTIILAQAYSQMLRDHKYSLGTDD